MILGQKNSFLAQFWPTKQAFFGSKTTRKQTRYHDNQATVFRKLQFFSLYQLNTDKKIMLDEK